jgi:hypothetical protein
MMEKFSGVGDQSYSKDIQKAMRFVRIWFRPDWIEISVFEEEIQDFPGFCEEKHQMFYD